MRKRLPHRIEVQKFTAVESQYGDRSGRTWATDRTEWGHMKPLSGFEGRIAGRDVSQVTHVCEMYYNPGDPLKPKDRLRWQSENYSITWIENVDGRDHSIRVFCRRVDS